MHLSNAFMRLFRREAAAPALVEKRDPAVITLISVIFSTQPKTFTGDAVYVTMSPPTIKTSVAIPTATDDDEDNTTSTGLNKSTGTGAASTRTGSSTGATITNGPSTTLRPASSAAISSTGTPSATAAASSEGMSGGAKAGLAFGIIILIALIAGGLFAFFKKRKSDREEKMMVDDEKAFLAAGRNPDALPSHATFDSNRPRTATTGSGSTFVNPFNEKPMPSPPVEDANRARFSYEDPAPQLSLRAVSQFEPSLPGDVSAPVKAGDAPSMPPNATANVAAAVGVAAAAGVAGAVAVKGAQSSSSTNVANDPNNPFGNHAEKLGTSPPQDIPLPVTPAGAHSGRVSPSGVQAADFPLPESVPGTPVNGKFPTPKPETATVAAAATGAAGVAGVAAIVAATSAAASNKAQGSAPTPGGPADNNVHRVHMDFLPSPNMEDELEIHAGQLVRVLYEYDDGWALCIRMDRSRQGVVPRTCLSKHPIKPRPASPSGRSGPPPPGMRGPGAPPPFAQPPRPLSPASGRGSPAPNPGSGRNSPAPYANAPRPLTPTQGGRARSNSNAVPFSMHNQAIRSQSPGPYGGSRLRPSEAVASRRRSNSVGNVSGLRKEASNAPSKIPAPAPAPAPASQIPSRKPVPGSSE